MKGGQQHCFVYLSILGDFPANTLEDYLKERFGPLWCDPTALQQLCGTPVLPIPNISLGLNQQLQFIF